MKKKDLILQMVAQHKLIKSLEHVISCYRERDVVKMPLNMEEAENEAIRRAMIHTGGNRKAAADFLGIGERTLYRKLRQFPVILKTQKPLPKLPLPAESKRKCKDCTFHQHCGSNEPCSMWELGEMVVIQV